MDLIMNDAIKYHKKLIVDKKIEMSSVEKVKCVHLSKTPVV